MSQISDTQIDKVLFHGQTAHQEIHTPSGQIPKPASDAPIVATSVAAFNVAGKQISAAPIVTPFQRISFVS